VTYPKQLVRLSPKGGFVSDVDPAEVGNDYFTGISNVIFRNSYAKRIAGNRSTYTTALATAAPTQLVHAINTEQSGTNYWLLFEDDGTAWAIEGNNATQIDNTLLTSVGDPYKHSSGSLNGVPIYSNSTDEPVYWAGANVVTLTDWTATESCKFITVFKYHIFAMDISGPGGTFPNLVKWSAAAEPGTIPNSWTPSSSNEAGSVELSDAPGAMLCAYPLRDMLVLYKRSAMYGAQYVGGNNIFNFRKLQSSSGCLTRRSVCDINGKHFVVSDGDIIITDGTNRVSVGESRVKDYFFNQLDSDNYLNTFCTYHRAKDEVLIGFPTSGSEFANTALVYDIQRNAFGVRDLPAVTHAAVGFINDSTISNNWSDRSDTWADAVDTWGSSSITGATDSLVLIHTNELEQQDTNDAVAVNASVGKHDMTMGQPERVKFVKRVHIRSNGDFGTVLIRVGSKMAVNDSTTWSNEQSLTSPDSYVNLFAQGRFLSVELRSTETTRWEITGIEIETELRGYF
jgi:hypothetical protein